MMECRVAYSVPAPRQGLIAGAPKNYCKRRVTSDEGPMRAAGDAVTSSSRAICSSARCSPVMASHFAPAQVTRQEWNPTLAPERMLAGKDLLLRTIRDPEHAVDLAHFVEAPDARSDREDVVLLSRFHEQRPRRDEAGDVVHLGPVQDAGHVVIDAMSQTPDAVFERVEITADECGADAGFERRREHGHG